MSWNDYINYYLLNFTDQSKGLTAKNVCNTGAIFGNADGTIWASTPGFALKVEKVTIDKGDGTTTETIEVNEFKNLLSVFNSMGKTTPSGGIRINGIKYYLTNFDDEKNIVYLKSSGGGAAVGKSNLGFVIGTFDSAKKLVNFNGKEEPQNLGLCNRAVEELQAFLLANNL